MSLGSSLVIPLRPCRSQLPPLLLTLLLPVVSPPVDATAGRVIIPQSTQAVHASTLTVGPGPEVGRGAAQPIHGLFRADPCGAGAAEVSTVGPCLGEGLLGNLQE